MIDNKTTTEFEIYDVHVKLCQPGNCAYQENCSSDYFTVRLEKKILTQKPLPKKIFLLILIEGVIRVTLKKEACRTMIMRENQWGAKSIINCFNSGKINIYL